MSREEEEEKEEEEMFHSGMEEVGGVTRNG